MLIRQLPELGFFQVGQWHFGAKTAKPTGLLVARLPQFFGSIWKRKLADVQRPVGQSIGIDANTGGFKTTSLKEYPPAFAAALAGAVTDQMQTNIRSGAHHVIDTVEPKVLVWVREAAECSARIHSWATMRADFQRG